LSSKPKILITYSTRSFVQCFFFGRVSVGWLHFIGQNLEGQGQSDQNFQIEQCIVQKKNVGFVPIALILLFKDDYN